MDEKRLQALSQINPGIGMKFILALSFALILAFVAGHMGLAPIVGALTPFLPSEQRPGK